MFLFVGLKDLEVGGFGFGGLLETGESFLDEVGDGVVGTRVVC